MFQETISTSFGAAFSMLPTSLLYVPHDAAQDSSEVLQRWSAPILQLRVPRPLLMDAPGKGASFIRLGCLQGEDARIGVAMAYAPGHYAMAVYDHGDPQAKDMSQAMLKAGRVHLMLRGEKDSMLVAVRLTELMRGVLKDCQNAAPSTFGVFADALSGITKALCEADTYREMGINPYELQTVTLSVCMPRGGQPTDVEVIPLDKVH